MPEEYAEHPLLRVTKTEDMIKKEYVQFHEILSTTGKRNDIQKVPRVYAEACLRTIASFEVLTRRQAIAAHAPAPSVPQGIDSGRPVQGFRATPSTSGQDAVVSSGVDADDDEDDDKEEIGSAEEEDSEGGSISSEYLGSEDTNYMALMDMTQKTSWKEPRQDTTSKSPPKRPRKK